MGALVALNAIFFAIGTSIVATGKATINPTAQAYIHLLKKVGMKPIFTYNITKDIKKLMPREIMRLIKMPTYLG